RGSPPGRFRSSLPVRRRAPRPGSMLPKPSEELSMRPRKEKPADPPAPQPPHVIHPHGVYFIDDAERLLRLRRSALRAEVKEGRLRVARRRGRYYLLGAWLLEWIRGGELHREKSTTA